jgi:transcription factor C subunit 6
MKIKLFEHEYRPAKLFTTPSDNSTAAPVSDIRGAARIVQGWPMVPNVSDSQPLPDGKKMKKSRDKKSQETQDLDIEGDEERQEDDVWTPGVEPQVIHEPFTRITVVAWNPNNDFGSWAAMAMASGLVRVADLGAV